MASLRHGMRENEVGKPGMRLRVLEGCGRFG